MSSVRLKQAKAIAIVSSGNFLEMYDFMVFGYFASAISRAFFPAGSEFASLMLALMTFGAGFLMRPVGALLLGAYIDRHGRRNGLIITLSLMALGTLIIAVTPTYASIGLAAPLLVVAGRLIQGFSAGVELGGVSVYLSEIAPPGRKGFYVAWQSASQQVAVMFAAGMGLLTNSLLTKAEVAA
jgi:MFS family permease